MCFSATASFGAGIVLSGIGVASIRRARSPQQKMFAGIPLIFAAQQATEGIVWLSLQNPAFAPLHQMATNIFIFFAQVVWPIWVPLSIIRLEPKEWRRHSEKVLVGIGMLVSLYLGYCLLNHHIEAKAIGYHISYIQGYPAALAPYCGFLYIVATIVPPFLSRIKHMWVLGATILISYIITTIFYTDYLVSVWCFFSSIISISVFAIVYELNKPKRTFATIKH